MMSGISQIVSVVAKAFVELYGDRLGEDETVESVTSSLMEQLSVTEKSVKKPVKKSAEKKPVKKSAEKKPVKKSAEKISDEKSGDKSEMDLTHNPIAATHTHTYSCGQNPEEDLLRVAHLDGMGKKELVARAKELNISGVSSLKVDDLRAKIRDILVNGAPTKIPKSTSGATADNVGDVAAKSDLKASKLVEKVAAKNVEDPATFITADKSLKEFATRMKLTNVLINQETGLVVHNKSDGRVAIGRLVGSKLVDLDDKCRALCKKSSIKVELLNAPVSSAEQKPAKPSAASDSESENSDSDDEKPAPVVAKKPAPKKAVSDSESDSDSPVPVAKKPAPAAKKPAPKKVESDSESDSDSPVPVAKKPAPAAKKPAPKKVESDSESDSD